MQDDNHQKPNPSPNQSKAVINNPLVQPISPVIKTNITPSPLPAPASMPAIPIQENTNATLPQNITTAEQHAFTPSNVYPEPSTSSQSDYPIGMTGSQMRKQKVRVPIGIYIIGGYTLIGFVIGLFDTTQNSIIYSIIMLLDLMLAIGLLLRLEIARKILLWLEGLTLAITILSFFTLFGLQQRLQTVTTNTNNSINRAEKINSIQNDKLEKIKLALAEERKKADQAIKLTYYKLGGTAAGTIVIIIYLMRPKVKEAFHELES
ncbi:MAG: hypothetical protein WCI37_00590 [bacterium]